MLAIDIVVPLSTLRSWQALVIRRLQAAGYDVAVLRRPGPPDWPGHVNRVLALERRLFGRDHPGLSAPLADIPPQTTGRQASLRLDLAGSAPVSDVPTVGLLFDGSLSDLAAVVAVAAGRLPVIEAVLDGKTVVGRALPMVDRRFSTALGVDDVFARAVTLVVSVVRAFAEGRAVEMGQAPAWTDGRASTGFSRAYLTSALPRLGREALRRARLRPAHWQVGYRFIDGAGVADTGRLGTGWRILPAPPGRFYADPFPFHWQGRPFVFVEDYSHATGKAVISVVPFDAAGLAQAPRMVLEEPHHLSYPQIFARDGAIWMLPEASASGKLTLYRAVDFPDRWVAEAVLLEGEISDATLLEHGGSLWLFATSRDGYGSTSDTLSVFLSPALAGPWHPHRLNPVLIDRRMARPGGSFVPAADGRILLPVQDGTLGYGGGLGLCELLRLDETAVLLSEPRPIETDGDWPYPRIHTLNRSGALEVIDGISQEPKRSAG